MTIGIVLAAVGVVAVVLLLRVNSKNKAGK